MLQLLEPVLYLHSSLVYMIYLTTINAPWAVIFTSCFTCTGHVKCRNHTDDVCCLVVDSSLYREIWHFPQDKLNMTTHHHE